MSELGKTFLNKSDQKFFYNNKINIKMPYLNKKPLARNGNLVETKKLGRECTMNGFGKLFKHKSNPKNRKNSKNQSEIAAYEQKTNSEKANFKFRAKKFPAAKPVAFWLHFLFRGDQNEYSNLKSKTMKICEQILKKDSWKNSGNDSKWTSISTPSNYSSDKTCRH